MKIEVIGKNSYRIFINILYLKDVNFENRDDINRMVKDFIKNQKNRLNLHGFYKVKVFPNKDIGVFLEINQLEELEFSNSLDLRIIVYLDEKFFFETDDYFIIKDYTDIRYLDGKFYCLLNDSCSDILKIVEFGRFIYGNEVVRLLNRSLTL